MKAEQNEFSEKIDVIIYLLQQSLDAQKTVVEWTGYDECKEFFIMDRRNGPVLLKPSA
ncbi:MAG: hypothetical protein JSS82_14590 [Bacteroidetes bacterium]|nr:hypothetical protein [Bacteroidota bacterium]